MALIFFFSFSSIFSVVLNTHFFIIIFLLLLFSPYKSEFYVIPVTIVVGFYFPYIFYTHSKCLLNFHAHFHRSIKRKILLLFTVKSTGGEWFYFVVLLHTARTLNYCGARKRLQVNLRKCEFNEILKWISLNWCLSDHGAFGEFTDQFRYGEHWICIVKMRWKITKYKIFHVHMEQCGKWNKFILFEN